MKPMSRREQRLVAILILVAVVAIGVKGIIAPIQGGVQSRRDERTQLLLQHHRNQQLAATMPLLRAAITRQRQDAERFALPASSQPEAVEQLRRRIRQLARGRNIVIKSVQEVDAPAGWAAVQAEARFQIGEMTGYLEALQAQSPIAPVQSLTITADAAFETGRPGPMEVRFEVAAPFAAPGNR